MQRIFLFTLLFFMAAWGCGGDCASCHANLDYKNDTRHTPMKDCKTCHSDEKMAQIDMGGCGQDCFACHSAQKLMTPKLSEAHKSIKACIQCHTNLTPFDSNKLFKKQSPKPITNNPFEQFKQ